MFNTEWSAVDYGHCLVKECPQSCGIKSTCRLVKHGSQDALDRSNLVLPDYAHVTR